MDNSTIIRRNIINNAIAQTKSAKSEAVRVRKEELKHQVATPKIEELRKNFDETVAGLKVCLEKDIQSTLDLADFQATSEVNAIYDCQIAKLEELLPAEED